MEKRWQSYFMDAALRAAEMSYSREKKVGAIAVRDNHIILDGFNGTLSGLDNVCEDVVMDGEGSPFMVTKDETEHAERNLIYYASSIGVPLRDAILFTTVAPCEHCARAIAIVGFKAVYFNEYFKRDTGLKILDSKGIPFEYIGGARRIDPRSIAIPRVSQTPAHAEDEGPPW